ncbi:hypothetical protein B0H16DRAFT_1729791 [Mycena metata]|uniref:Uncharacterized protein n=1 Tax=Mycena metata TaxID=1033252 RepID=A0AAD7IB39_9AGAR|nr:hypothetical protein B0H16DRAFT_1729791 [Mycena metata]
MRTRHALFPPFREDVQAQISAATPRSQDLCLPKPSTRLQYPSNTSAPLRPSKLSPSETPEPMLTFKRPTKNDLPTVYLRLHLASMTPPCSHGITAKAPRPKRADVKSTAAQLAATKRYRQANLLALREKARARVTRRREQAKGTELEVGLKASERLNHARSRERNKAELAHRQRTRRAQAYVAKHGWDAWVDHSDRLNLHAQKRTATAQRQLDEDLAEAEEEAEWAARRLKQAQGASGLSCSAIDAGAGDDDD